MFSLAVFIFTQFIAMRNVGRKVFLKRKEAQGGSEKGKRERERYLFAQKKGGKENGKQRRKEMMMNIKFDDGTEKVEE